METIVDSAPPSTDVAAVKARLFSAWLPYFIAACLMVLGIVQTLRVIQFKKELAQSRRNLEVVQAQKIEDAARKNLAELHLTLLQAKDPAYATASISVVWNPALNEGIVTLQNLPAPPAGRDYQLWVLDPKALAPLNAGVLNIATASRHFTEESVSLSGPGFAVSLEPTGGVPATTGPILFAVAPQE